MQVARPNALKVTVSSYTDSESETILHIVLQNRDITVELTNIGCAITSIRTPDRNQLQKNIVAGFTNLELYKINKDYFGCVVGRYANRIANGTFVLNGTPFQLTINDAPNHLHGGCKGFSHKIWKLNGVIENEHECGAEFSYYSPDGEEGYPGNLAVTVKYVLDNKNRLSILYTATTDKSTPVNLTNHSYFNLTGFENPTVMEHYLQVNGDRFTEKSVNNTSTGNIASVYNTNLDFTKPKLVGRDIADRTTNMGYDHNFILNSKDARQIVKAAVLSEETTGRVLNVYTDRPAMQVYTANYWNGTITGEQGRMYQKHGGVALETQSYPGSVNHPHFPGTILHPGQEYQSTTVFEFGIDGETNKKLN
jgi:aldose 1-epimerase